jgi:tRNA threonylcarbamoyladenosine biosynthesis protein TsaE
MKPRSIFSCNFIVPNLGKFEEFGVSLGQLIPSSFVIALNGELGSGKTTLVRSLCQGLGCSSLEFVTSPTFVLMQEYQGRYTVNHLDVYRLESELQFLEFGGDELFQGGNVVLIEWADKIKNCLPPARMEIILEVVSQNERRICVSLLGDVYCPAILAYLSGFGASV